MSLRAVAVAYMFLLKSSGKWALPVTPEVAAGAVRERRALLAIAAPDALHVEDLVPADEIVVVLVEIAEADAVPAELDVRRLVDLKPDPAGHVLRSDDVGP